MTDLTADMAYTGPILNKDVVLREAYRLLGVVAVDAFVHKITLDEEKVLGGSRTSGELLWNLHHSNFDDELHHSLISLAIYNRTHIERTANRRDGVTFEECGILIENTESETEVPLSFWEACNKVVHSKKIRVTQLDRDGNVYEATGQRPIQPCGKELWLYGKKKNGKSWHAKLDVLQFIRQTVKNFDTF